MQDKMKSKEIFLNACNEITKVFIDKGFKPKKGQLFKKISLNQGIFFDIYSKQGEKIMTNNRSKLLMIVMILVVGFMAISCDMGNEMTDEQFNLDGVWRNNWAIAHTDRLIEHKITFNESVGILEFRYTEGSWVSFSSYYQIEEDQMTLIPFLYQSPDGTFPLTNQQQERYTIILNFKIIDRNTIHLIPSEWHNNIHMNILVQHLNGHFERVR